jgi:predicted dehydrogenase
MVAESHAFVPSHILAKEMVDQGRMGRVFLAKAYEIVGDVPVEYSWKTSPEAVGSLLDMGVHRFFVLRWIMGEVKSVFAFAEKLACELETDNDDTAVIALKFKNGALGEVDLTCCAVSEPTNRLELYGTKGTIIEDHMWEQPLMYCSNQPGFETEGWVKPEVEHAPFPGYYGISFRNEVEHFVDCVLNDTQPKVTGEDGRAALNIALLAYKSVKTGKVVMVNE